MSLWFEELKKEKDACYRKVRSRYKKWPSAYASGALVQCRKKGAANWGNSKTVKKESKWMKELSEKKQELLEMKYLFGYKKGAFTGATTDKVACRAHRLPTS